MHCSWFLAILGQKSRHALGLLSRNATSQCFAHNPISKFLGGSTVCGLGVAPFRLANRAPLSIPCSSFSQNAVNFCSLPGHVELGDTVISVSSGDSSSEKEDFQVAADHSDCNGPKAGAMSRESIDFSNIPIPKLPTVLIIGRPNVGKSALFNRLIRRREALVLQHP